MLANRKPPASCPLLRVGTVAHVFADPPECKHLEGPAMLVQKHGDGDRLGFEPWEVIFSNSTRRELRYVHPFDMVFTLGPAAALAAVGVQDGNGSLKKNQGGSHAQ